MARKNKENAPKKKSKVGCFIFVFLFIALGAVVALKFDDVKALYHTAVDMISEMINPTEYQGMTKKEPYKIAYVSNGDGTCYVSEIITNPLYEGYYALEIPETSPDGDKVTAIKSSGFLGSLIAPIMREEDFDRYIKEPMLAFYNGNEDNFYYKSFMSYWDLRRKTDMVLFPQLASELQLVQQYFSIYVLDSEVTPVEIAMLEENLRLCVPEYTPEQCYILMDNFKENLKVVYKRSSRLDKAFNTHTGGGTMIQKIILPDTLESIDSYAFAGCSSVSYIDIPDGVTFIGDHAFACCESLVDIDIPQGVTEIKEGTYMGCFNLINVIIPDHITIIEANAFNNCRGLISVRIPQNVRRVDETSFDQCANLVDVYNAAGDYHIELDGINIYSPTEGESKLITSGDFVFYYDDEETRLLLKAYLGSETDVVLPSSVEVNGKIFEEYVLDSYVFYYDRNITSIVIPNTVTDVGSYNFYICESLTHITIPQTDDTWLFGAFLSCGSLKEITFDGTTEEWKGLYGEDNNYFPRLNQYTIHCSDGDIVIEQPERVTLPLDK